MGGGATGVGGGGYLDILVHDLDMLGGHLDVVGATLTFWRLFAD